MKEDLIQGLGEAVLYWLCFQNLCGRSSLLSEHYLSQPIGEYLLYHCSGRLDSEVNHPNLNNGGKGRPRQVDFCLFSRDDEYMTDALELKWISGDSFNKQRVVDDIMRLERLRIQNGYHVFRYFLVAGKEVDFRENFIECFTNLGQGGGRINFFGELLDFSASGEKTILFDNLNEPQKNSIRDFAVYYTSSFPNRFKTKCVFGESRGNFTVYIWRIYSIAHRKLLNAL